MRPERSNSPSDTIYHGMVIIPHIRGISKKFRHTGNHFNVKTIFKTKHTLHGTLMKTGSVRNVQQTKQCVYCIPCDCGRCYTGEPSRPSEVCNKEHKYKLSQGLHEKSKQAKQAYKEGQKYCHCMRDEMTGSSSDDWIY
jgi:hypothetical protein